MRVLSSNEHLASVLEQYWNGYAARRGPLAYERNLLKLAWLLSGAPAGATAVAPEKEAITDAIADVLDLAWALEGEELEAVSDAEEAVRFRGAEAHAQTEPVRQALIERLQDIATAAERAAAALDSSA
jgi:hypothetical protein